MNDRLAAWHDAVERQLNPPDPKRGPFHPAGTFVTGFTQTGLFVSSSHKGHVFELVSDPIEAEWTNSGKQQRVGCIVCGDIIIPMTDCEFLTIKATPADVERAISEVRLWQGRLASALQKLTEWRNSHAG